MEWVWHSVWYMVNTQKIVALTITSTMEWYRQVINLLRSPNYRSALSPPLSHLMCYQLCQKGAFIPILQMRTLIPKKREWLKTVLVGSMNSKDGQCLHILFSVLSALHVESLLMLTGTSKGKLLLVYPFYRSGAWDIERLKSWLNVTELVNTRAGVGTSAILAPGSLPLTITLDFI